MNYIILMVFVLLFSCNTKPKLTGYYSTCDRGLYGELFFKNDSMKMATSMDFISGWRKYEIKNDSFYHLSFGESESRIAKINFINDNTFELIYPKDSSHHIFKKVNAKIDEDVTVEQFFKAFYKRKKNMNCFKEYEKK